MSISYNLNVRCKKKSTPSKEFKTLHLYRDIDLVTSVWRLCSVWRFMKFGLLRRFSFGLMIRWNWCCDRRTSVCCSWTINVSFCRFEFAISSWSFFILVFIVSRKTHERKVGRYFTNIHKNNYNARSGIEYRTEIIDGQFNR